jgi:hypothetical protein
MAKEEQLPARFPGPNKVHIGRFGVSMSLIDSPKSFKSLRIRFESSTMALTNLTTFEVTVGATILVEVEIEDR